MQLGRTPVVGAVWAGMVIAAAGASAGTVTFGEHSAVATPDFVATFDDLDYPDSMANYSEGGLWITVPDLVYLTADPSGGRGGFSGGFAYPDSGSPELFRISAVDGTPLQAIEFNVGSGRPAEKSSGVTYLRYEIYVDGTMVDFGAAEVALGGRVGVVGQSAFDEIRIGGFTTLAAALLGTASQALAFDNLWVQAATAVPSPVAAAGAIPVLLGLQSRRRRSGGV